MWKKQEDEMGVQPEFGSKQTPESVGDGSLIDSRFEKWDHTTGPQKLVAEGHYQPSSSPNMTTYTEALNEFTRSATAFIEQLPLLTKARDAYEQAMTASSEMRKVLDAGEENLRSLMIQLEQAVNIHGVKPADKKKPELAKVEAIRSADESSSAAKRYP
jgi:hypothetical protein